MFREEFGSERMRVYMRVYMRLLNSQPRIMHF